MLKLRPAVDRGHSQLDWLDSWHTFSFDQYYDPQHMSFGPLRVINEDTIAGGGGFGMHPHRDMEIITYVTSGKLRHQDSMGNGSIISSGEIQKMSAGTGVWHSEHNASADQPVHLLQIWIMPEQKGLKPSYEQERFELKEGEWKLLGSPDGDGLISIRQKVKLYALSAADGQSSSFQPQKGSKLWIQIVKGQFAIQGKNSSSGDGVSIEKDETLELKALSPGEILLFEILDN